MAVYALGMAVPLFLMALLWDRLDLGRRRWLRGREMSFGPLRIHTTNLVSGLMFVALGTVFVAYEGTSALSGLYEENGTVGLAHAAERWVGSLSPGFPDYLLVAVLVVAAVALALARVGGCLRNRVAVPERGPRDGEETSR